MDKFSYDDLLDEPIFDVSKHLFGGFYEDGRTEQANLILNELIAKYGKPLCGRNRATFRLKNHVFKFPLNNNGEVDNEWEGCCRAVDYAISRYVLYRGFICVMAEIIEEIPFNDLPEWAKWTDGAGRCKKGHIKVFDYGIR